MTALVARSRLDGARGHAPDLRPHRCRPRGGVLQRRLHRQRQPRARRRRPGLPQDRGGAGRRAARCASRRRLRHRASYERLQADPLGVDRGHDGRRRGAHLGAEARRDAAVRRASTRASSRSRRSARSRTSRSPSRWPRAAAAGAPRRRRKEAPERRHARAATASSPTRPVARHQLGDGARHQWLVRTRAGTLPRRLEAPRSSATRVKRKPSPCSAPRARPQRGARGRAARGAAGPATRLGRRDRRPIVVPPPPPAHVRGRRGPGACREDPAQRR